MITHKVNPSKVIKQINDIFTAKGFHIPEITFHFVGSTGGAFAYGFWITARPQSFGFAEMRELIELFHSSGFKPLSIQKRQKDIVIFAL